MNNVAFTGAEIRTLKIWQQKTNFAQERSMGVAVAPKDAEKFALSTTPIVVKPTHS